MLNSISSFLGEGANIIWFMIALPAGSGVLIWLLRKSYALRLPLTVLFSAVNLIFAISLYQSGSFYRTFPFASHGMDIAFHIYEFPAMFLIFTAAAFLLVSLYSVAYLKDEKHTGSFMLYLYLSLAMVNGALLSDNLNVMLFFWEGLLCTLFGMLLINNKQNPKAATKALVLSGTANLILMLGIIITVYQAGTPNITQMQKLPVEGISGIGFVCMMLGAAGMAGCMPFHSWIPDAADDSPIPFMAAIPGLMEKLLGIYLAVHIVTNLYDLQPESGMSIAVMTLGMITVIFADAMALVQTDMKRLISYNAISQTGYMVLGVGTAIPAGIAGSLFHMISYIILGNCLFMAAGNIEKQTGSANLRTIGGLAKRMPVTMACFAISGLAAAGIPPFGVFFPKGLIISAVLKTNVLFYIGILASTFLTAAYFLKAGLAAFAGEIKLPAGKKHAWEAGFGMLLPMSVLALLGILPGFAIKWLMNGLPGHAPGYMEIYSRWPLSALSVIIPGAAIVLGVCDHIYGYRKSGSAADAADHICNAPVLKSIYQAAGKKWLDPYNWLNKAVNAFSAVCALIERGISWFYDDAAVKTANGVGYLLQRFNNGSLSRYLMIAVAGVGGLAVIFLVILL